MLALAEYRADLHVCGHPLSESTKPEYDRNNPQRTAEYKVGPPHVCHACAATYTAMRAYRDSEVPPPESLLFVPELTSRG